MKRFIKKILIFITPLMIMALSMDGYLRTMNTLYKAKIKGLLDNNESIQVLILGNSQATYGVDPGQFDLYAYNLANVSQSIYFDRRLTMKYREALPNLKYVFISVDYHSLFFSSQGDQGKIRNIWSYYGNGIKYKDTNYLLPNISYFIFGYGPVLSIAILKKDIRKKWNYRNEENIIDFDVETGINLKDNLIKGYISFEGTKKGVFNEEILKTKADSFTLTVTESKEKNDVISDLTGFILDLKAAGIVPILFSTPCFSGYNSHLSKSIIAQNKRDIDLLCNKLNVDFWDYASYSLPDLDFYNGNHLNKKGASKFSQILNARLNSFSSGFPLSSSWENPDPDLGFQ